MLVVTLFCFQNERAEREPSRSARGDSVAYGHGGKMKTWDDLDWDQRCREPLHANGINVMCMRRKDHQDLCAAEVKAAKELDKEFDVATATSAIRRVINDYLNVDLSVDSNGSLNLELARRIESKINHGRPEESDIMIEIDREHNMLTTRQIKFLIKDKDDE